MRSCDRSERSLPEPHVYGAVPPAMDLSQQSRTIGILRTDFIKSLNWFMLATLGDTRTTDVARKAFSTRSLSSSPAF